jgi:hypothetical protein
VSHEVLDGWSEECFVEWPKFVKSREFFVKALKRSKHFASGPPDRFYQNGWKVTRALYRPNTINLKTVDDRRQTDGFLFS